jgi:hypothetical protein
MMSALQDSFRSLPTFSSRLAGDDDISRLVSSDRGFFYADHIFPSFQHAFSTNLVLQANGSRTLVQREIQAKAFSERLFDSLVSLKVAFSQYAMHLDSNERHRLFEELDSKLNVDDWHEDDALPRPTSFVDFLKWMIHAKYFDWTSIGVSAEGTILVAWKTPRAMLTANFENSGSVRWTAQVKSENGEVGQSAGKCTLRLFTEQALFYLGRTLDGQVDQHQQS